ncbi:DUF262 domain-containing protein [Sphingobacterium lactis]|uniref:DUF262 domain-containing protein n=1 Tax=Sphingobacterium lactis TaxID=797291 RepID=UPI003DA3C0FD
MLNNITNPIKLNKIGLLDLQNLAEYNPIFFVSDYQRGYRWEKMQIIQLLNDILHNPKGKTYCLQPIMLTDDTRNKYKRKSYEVIDGQQRLTTLFLILKVLYKKTHSFALPYTIDYSTRESCILFLENIDHHAFVNDDVEIEKHWEEINVAEKNIDNYHLFHAYQNIHLWVQKHNIDVNDFLVKVMTDIKLIWYPVVTSNELNAKKMFRNINSGKIRLTSSDLIKALFVLNYQSLHLPLPQRNQLKIEFSNQWNNIEKQLNQDSFWFFITNHYNVEYPTRIGLLFDLVTQSYTDKNPYTSYLKYAEGEVPLQWERIVDVYRKIHEWYTNEKYYHRIGFLINANCMSFASILDLYDKHKMLPKSSFYKALNDAVIAFTHSFNLDTINYLENRSTCKNLLLLYNIFIFEKDFPQQKFPFDKYVKEEWSLEHIHPQNPQDFTQIEDVIFWLEDTKKVLIQKKVDISEDLPVIGKINIFLDRVYTEEHAYNKKAKEDIREIKDLLEREIATHKINNLVLLDKATNSKLGNGLFKNKRDTILKTNGNYVPYATVNCFVKKFTDKDFLQNEFWSEADADYYLNSIKTVIYG